MGRGGWRWVEVDGGESRWIEMSGDGWRWRQMGGGGGRWVEWSMLLKLLGGIKMYGWKLKNKPSCTMAVFSCGVSWC